MKFTGERFVPEVHGNIELEHLHRYLLACKLAAGKVVLDIASGEGYGSAMLAKTANKVIGVDISNEAIMHAQEKYQAENLSFRLGSCSAIPLEDGSVDMVVSFETIEHHNEHDAMMREIKRVLRPGGVLVISSPDKLEFSDKPGTVNPHHVKELYSDEFKKLLGTYFKNQSIFGQRVVYGSAILCEDSISPIQSYELADKMLTAIPGVPHAVYLVAVASDSEIPILPSGILEQCIEDTEITHFWRDLMADRDSQIATLNQVVSERDSQNANLSKVVEHLNQQISKRDEQIAHLDERIAYLDERIAHLDERIVHLVEQRKFMMNSISWKITKPLRFIRGFLR